MKTSHKVSLVILTFGVLLVLNVIVWAKLLGPFSWYHLSLDAVHETALGDLESGELMIASLQRDIDSPLIRFTVKSRESPQSPEDTLESLVLEMQKVGWVVSTQKPSRARLKGNGTLAEGEPLMTDAWVRVTDDGLVRVKISLDEHLSSAFLDRHDTSKSGKPE